LYTLAKTTETTSETREERITEEVTEEEIKPTVEEEVKKPKADTKEGMQHCILTSNHKLFSKPLKLVSDLGLFQ